MGNKGLPPGFRFHPTDVELVKYYLKRKVLGKKMHFEAIAELDIYKYAPWDLPDRSLLRTGDLKWYFFCPREKKYSSGTRMNRATDLGFWKTTGKDRPVHYKNEAVGMIKTLVFHRGKAPKGDRTDWVMYEYRLEENELSTEGVAQDSYVLCSIFKKDGPGPRNGAQYGAPFNEEDWDDDDVGEVNGVHAVYCAGISESIPPINHNQPITTSLLSPPEALPSTSNSVAVVADDHASYSEAPQDSIESDDIFTMLANFSEDISLALAQNEVNEVDALNPSEMVNNHDHFGENEAAPWSDGFDIYKDLGDLGNLVGYNEQEDSISACHDFNYTMEEISGIGNGQFLELMDLDVPLNCGSDAGGYDKVQSDLHHIANHSSSAELVSGSSEFGKGNSFVETSNLGWYDFQASALTNTSAVFCQTSIMGSEQTSEPIRRGGEEERNRVSSEEGSSIHIVKAEVTLRTCRCTKDALSEKLEESLCIIYGVCHAIFQSQEYLRFLIYSYVFLRSDTQLVSSSIYGSGSGSSILSFQLLDPLFWVEEVKWIFTSSVNNMYVSKICDNVASFTI
ncbi:uncharacterized protein [Euphorbia lathyris]|uniref:uncharacterized protein isoform X2 n=1 Tax=Euphorbia lathyris TaxID=212925 RepID=UPI0033142E69